MSWLLALLVPQPFLGVFCSNTNLVVQERGGLALWIGGLARAFLSIVYVSAHDLGSEPPMKVRLPCCFQKHEKCLRVQSLEKTASLLWLDSLMNQVIISRFPLQVPLNCYLIKRWYQAVTHKAGSIITMELEKYLFPDVIPPGKGHSVLWKDPSSLLLETIMCQATHLPGTVFSGCQMGYFTGVLRIRSDCSSD